MQTLGALGYELVVDHERVDWDLLDATLEEALHELPLYTFDALSDALIPPDVLGKTLAFTLARKTPDGTPDPAPLLREGTVIGVELLHRVDDRRFRTRLRVSSPAHALSLGRHCRVFQKKAVHDVVQSVASENGLDVVLASVPGAREMCTQFMESDYDFVRRLCEDAGLSLIFHASGATAFTTLNGANPDAFEGLGELVLPPGGRHANVGVECVHAFSRDLRAAPHSVKAADFSMKDGRAVVGVGPAHASLGVAADNDKQTLHAPGAVRGHHPAVANVAPSAGFEAHALTGVHDLRRGSGNARVLRAGATFELDDQSSDACSGKYLVTRVQHRVTFSEEPDADGNREVVYANDFECVSGTAPHRPPRAAPRPVALAPQSALVVDFPARDPGHGMGEVCVAFHWPTEDVARTAWVRVAQLLAGESWGAQFLPRVGMEVIVQFLNGDPDRPVVTGSVYNGRHAPPAKLADQHTRSAIRTHSYASGGSGPDNEVFFEDADGAEVLGLVATRDHKVEVTHDALVHVGNNHTEAVDGDAKLTVKRTLGVTVEDNRTGLVKGVDKLTVEKNQEVLVKQNAKTTVYQKLTFSADAGIVLQCGDTRLELTPTAVTIVNSAQLKIEMTPSAFKLEHPAAGSVEMTGPGVTVKSSGGAKVEMVGPVVNVSGAMVNLN